MIHIEIIIFSVVKTNDLPSMS